MTAEQVVALLSLIADLRLQVIQQQIEIGGLQHRLDLATGATQGDDADDSMDPRRK